MLVVSLTVVLHAILSTPRGYLTLAQHGIKFNIAYHVFSCIKMPNDEQENTWYSIPNGRIYSSPLKAPNPKGMSAYCDRYVFCEWGYTVNGCMSENNIKCVPLDPNSSIDNSIRKWQEKERQMQEWMEKY